MREKWQIGNLQGAKQLAAAGADKRTSTLTVATRHATRGSVSRWPARFHQSDRLPAALDMVMQGASTAAARSPFATTAAGVAAAGRCSRSGSLVLLSVDPSMDDDGRMSDATTAPPPSPTQPARTTPRAQTYALAFELTRVPIARLTCFVSTSLQEGQRT
jgi:hypothetical protein